MFFSSSFPTSPRVTCALLSVPVLAAVAAPQARAVMVIGGTTIKAVLEAEAVAHQKGKVRKEVVGLMVQSKRAPGKDGRRFLTGVFLGYDDDRNTGAILTAGHVFCPEGVLGAEDLEPELAIAFGSQILGGMNGPAPYLVPAGRVILHPDYHLEFLTPATGGKSMIPRKFKIKNDLAIVEFDAGPHREALAKLGVAAAVLYDGEGYRDWSLVKVEIVGFGCFATNTTNLLNLGFRVHSGGTRVTFGTFEGRPAFYHWSPLDPERFAAVCKTDDPRNNYQPFILQRTPMELYYPEFKVIVKVQSHEQQALFTAADSGGPFFVLNKNIPKVAGIASGFRIDKVFDDKGAESPFTLQYWEPVTDKLPWIARVRKGNYGASRVIQVADAKTILAAITESFRLAADATAKLPPDGPGAEPKDKKAP